MKATAIDIGTNTLLMAIAEVDEQGIHPLADHHRIARLGQDVERTGTISPAAIERATAIIEDYRRIADDYAVQHRFAVGTSVFRLAANADAVAARLAEVWGAPIAIISGDEEAELTFYGTIPPTDGDVAVLDIGGGSTELVMGTSRGIRFRVSIEIGAVRLAERYWHTFPADSATIERARQEVYTQLAALVPQTPPGQLYAVAGTPTTLALMAQNIAAFDWERVDGYPLERDTLDKLWQCISTATLRELLSMPGVHPQRADILPAGTLILQACMDWLKVDSLIVSARGLRYGVLLRAFAQAIAKSKVS